MPTTDDKAGAVALAVLGLVILAVGMFMLGAGIYLIMLGGSWYFALAGLGLSIAAVLLVRRRMSGAALYLLILAATVVWALWK